LLHAQLYLPIEREVNSGHISLMCSLLIAIHQPLIQINLQAFQISVELLAEAVELGKGYFRVGVDEGLLDVFVSMIHEGYLLWFRWFVSTSI
jgi:hypothetical protein